MKLIRYILFLPICFMALGIVYWGFNHLLSWFIGLSTFWLIVVLLLLGGTIWFFFKILSAFLIHYTSMLAPSRTFSFWTIFALSLFNGIWAIYNTWTLDLNYSSNIIFGAIVFSILVLELTFALIYGSVIVTKETYQ